jgi:hypothetical protein
MSTFPNAAPLANLQGIQDVSGRPLVIDPESLPSHLPHVYLFAQKGSTEPQLVSGDSFTQTYGDQTLEPRSPYFNHQSVLANTLQGQGNAMMVQRVIPADAAPRARFLLSFDSVADSIQQYQRNADGSYALDPNGAKIPKTGSGATVPGLKGKWVLNSWLVDEDTGLPTEAFGECVSRVGTLVSGSSTQSQLVPIIEFEVTDIGGYGNNIGVRFTAPTTLSAAPANDAIVAAIKAFMYRFQIVQRTDPTVLPVTVKTLQGEEYVEFALKDDAYYLPTDTELGISKIALSAYESLDVPGTPNTYGPFGRMHVYEANLEAMLLAVGSKEAPYGLFDSLTMSADSDELFLVNPFTATDVYGVPYYSLVLSGPEDGGVFLTDTTTLYASGGGDGTMTLDSFDALVKSELANYGNGEADLLDDAKYPQSCIYDTGFTLPTKLALISVIGKRKDMWVALSTQDVSLPQNTPTVESSIAVSLKTAARNFPESAIFGTSVCRAVVIGHSGYLLNSKYTGLLPLTIEFASKIAAWQGAGNGVWKPGLGFDVPNNNQITLFRGVNAVFKQATVRNQDWATGLVWVQNYDRRSVFWPAVQTVYDDDSSVLNSAVNMMVAVELEKVAQRTWRDLTGIGNLTADQFIERSNKLIDDRTTGRFDGRVTIQAETFYTAGDVQRGYSWASKIHMYAPNMKTVGTYTIVAHRQSDLNQAA